MLNKKKQKISKIIKKFFKIYFSEIRQYKHKSPTINFRPIYNNFIRIECQFLKDKSLAIYFYPSEKQDAFFVSECNQSRDEKMKENLLNMSLNKRTDESRYVEKFIEDEWTTKEAERQATDFYYNVVQANIINSPSEIIIKYEKDLKEFEALLNTAKKESELQEFLEKHHQILCPDAIKVFPKIALGEHHETDFVIKKHGSEYIFVEIENANNVSLFNKNGDFSADLTHAEKQINDWKQWLSDNKDYFKRAHFSDLIEPKFLIIIGRKSTPDNQKKLQTKNHSLHFIQIMTYDDVLDNFKNYLINLKKQDPPPQSKFPNFPPGASLESFFLPKKY